MTYEVWHARRPAFGLAPRRFPGEFTHVALVECRDLDKAYELTNNLGWHWSKNPEVKAASDKLRSTSVGDVIIAPDGMAHSVESVGFAPIGHYKKGRHLADIGGPSRPPTPSSLPPV